MDSVIRRKRKDSEVLNGPSGLFTSSFLSRDSERNSSGSPDKTGRPSKYKK